MKTFNVKIYDTYQGKVVPFTPLKENQVSIYYCGPTVYNYGHIGNFRPPVFFDLVHRFFNELGYDVKLVSNYTDIDDKIINTALKEKKSEKELSSFFITAYEDSLNKLNILPLYCHPRVSETMDDIIEFVQLALDKNVAYKAGDDVLFSVGSVEDYGSLSKIKMEDLIAGTRIAVTDNKRSPMDFVLWKKTDDEGIKFHADFGDGRPGWHTECLVMINKIFGRPLIDIHGGGFDLKFPHHENERAQAEAVYNSPLANNWMHVGFINMGDEKMSKSLGNVVYMKDFLEKYNPDIFRLFVLKGYYRSPLVYTDESIKAAENEVKKYINCKKSAELYVKYHGLEEGKLLDEYYDPFMEALADDFNVPNALAIFDKLVKDLNNAIRQKQEDLIASLYFTFDHLRGIIGLKLETPTIDEEVLDLYREFEKLRSEKNYQEADKIRAILIEKKIL